jgi:hypothetical protein
MATEKDIREPTVRLLLRITDEQVPLFGSERLKTLHADCRKLLDDIAARPTEPRADLYRCQYTSAGYVVYRKCFHIAECSHMEGVAAHTQATFVDEIAALDYCRYRNSLIDERGTDEIPA